MSELSPCCGKPVEYGCNCQKGICPCCNEEFWIHEDEFVYNQTAAVNNQIRCFHCEWYCEKFVRYEHNPKEEPL